MENNVNRAESIGDQIINQSSNQSQPSPAQTAAGPQQPEVQPQPIYVPQGIPAEMPKNKSGRTHGIIAIICGVISIFLLPPVLGITGIILGNSAIKKGEKALGITAIVLSSVCMVAGMIFGALIYLNKEADVAGSLFPIFY